MPHRRIRSLLAAAVAVSLGTALAATTMVANAAAAGCRVSYTVSSQWQGGFGANVAITNLGDPIDGWTLRWSFGAGQTLTQAWNTTATQSGSAVTATSMTYNAALGTGASAAFGFNGAWNGSNPVPTSFTLNNVACTGGTTTSAPTAVPTTTRPSPTPPTTSPTVAPTTVAPTTGGPTSGPPPAKTVRVFWLKPTNVAYNQRYPDGIAAVMREAQRYYKQELGKTFTLNSTVVEVVNGEHDTNWYINNNCDANGDRYWCVVYNMQAELMRRFGISGRDSRWLCVGEVSAEDPGKSGGGGGPGWVILSGHDADGAAGTNGSMNRWYGGMVHELGHGFGLPDSSSTDGTPMSASFYNYPNTHFSQAQKNAIMSGPYGSFLS